MTSVWLLNSCHYNHVKWLTGILAAATFLFIITTIIIIIIIITIIIIIERLVFGGSRRNGIRPKWHKVHAESHTHYYPRV